MRNIPTPAGNTEHLDAETVAMLQKSLHHVLGETADGPLDDRLAELGWDEVVAGAPSTALRTLFEVKGDLASSADALGPALTARLAQLTGDDALADTTVAVSSPFGSTSTDYGWIRVDATALSPAIDRPFAVAVDGRLAVCPSAGVKFTSLDSTDGGLGLYRLTGVVAATDVEWLDGAVAERLVDHGRWLVACELVGVGRHVLAGAVDYTKDRVQFGKPIGVFQALQHRLASAHAMVVAAGHLAAEAGDSGDGWAALVAKCMAGRAAEYACTQAQQCYGAIGFTWEHELHRYLRRTYSLDRMLGDWRSLEHEIGVRLQESCHAPRIGTL